jgi:nicotinamidase-related amidase
MTQQPIQRKYKMVDAEFFTRCALVSVDFQEGEQATPITEAGLPPDWRAMGFTAEDVNAASTFAREVSLPNALTVLNACREAGLPRIFIHWGYRFADGMDLDPVIRSMMIRNHGTDYAKWQGFIGQPGSRPPVCFAIQQDEYVLPKTAQDAFISSNLDFVLANLGVVHLILIGGHTEACLGKTATSAKRRGFRTLCASDATTNARESTRLRGIQEAQFDYTVTSVELIQLLGSRTA